MSNDKPGIGGTKFNVKLEDNWMGKGTPLTLEHIESVLSEYFKGLDIKLTVEELKAKILMGYQYQIRSEGDGKGSRKMSLNTGKGGILMYIDACTREGIPAALIQDSIEVWVDGQFHKLADATVTKKPVENGS